MPFLSLCPLRAEWVGIELSCLQNLEMQSECSLGVAVRQINTSCLLAGTRMGRLPRASLKTIFSNAWTQTVPPGCVSPQTACPLYGVHDVQELWASAWPCPTKTAVIPASRRAFLAVTEQMFRPMWWRFSNAILLELLVNQVFDSSRKTVLLWLCLEIQDQDAIVVLKKHVLVQV